MRGSVLALSASLMALACALPQSAHAQRANENAVTNADDAFGTNVGLESSGIYTEGDTRGFSPTKAGNVRVDGIYADVVGVFAGRLRESTAIRVGFSAQEYPFHAPTGIVDHKFRPFANELGTSLAYNHQPYNGWITEWDLRVPIVKDHVTLTGGRADSLIRMADGSGNHGWGTTIRPIIRYGGMELSLFGSEGGFRKVLSRPLVVVTGDYLPQRPKERRYLGQRWARGRSSNNNYGATLKAAVTGRLSIRAGVFHSAGPRKENYTEIYTLLDRSGLASHRMIADPRQKIDATSGEAQIVYRFASGDWQHRIVAGYRSRNRRTETGGSDVRDFGQVIYGEPDPEPEQTFTYSRVNSGRVRQSSWMLGYIGKIDGLGAINLGVQKARYRGTFRDGRTGLASASRDNPWLYNATLSIDLTDSLSAYFGTERGLEDSGAAPENALNRNEQLPSTRTTQYEGGLRWKFHGGQLVANVFQITKPYFTFDQTGRFERLGSVRHRGVETSLSTHIGTRFNLLAGAVLMQPRVGGEGRDLGLVGRRPAGTPSVYARIDANYRTDIFGGLTPTAALIYTGKRAVGARPLASLGGGQLMTPASATVDLGVRQRFHVGKVPASLRATVHNIFDRQTWKIVAANTLYPDEERRFSLTLAADF